MNLAHASERIPGPANGNHLAAVQAQRPLPFNVDLALWLRLGLLREVGYTTTGVMSYSLTPAGRALLANRLACEAEDGFPVHS